MKERGLHLFVLLFFSLFTFLLFWPIFLGKVNLNGHLLVSFYAIYGENLPFKDTGWDQLRIYFPFYKITLDALRQFSLPFWNPYAFSGHPHLADFQTAVFYPLNLLGLFVSQISFWHILRLTPTIFASFFTFAYLRNLKLNPIASFFGALVFGFSPFIITWGEEVVMSPHSIVYLPLALLAIDKLQSKFSRFYFFVLVVSVCLSIFAGYLQTTIYLLVLAFFYLLYRAVSLKLNFKFYTRVISGILVGIVISSIQLLPSIELFFNSQRSGVDFSNFVKGFLLPPISLITYLAPDFFGNPATRNHFLGGYAQYYEAIMFVGIAPLLFSFYAICKKRSSLIIFFIVSAIVSLATVVDSFISRIFVSLPIPLVSTAIPHRILFIPAFSFAVLGAIGLDSWLKSKKSEIFKTIIFFAFLYVCVLIYLAYKAGYFAPDVNISPEQVVSLRNLVVPLAAFITITLVVTVVPIKKYAAVLIIIVSALNIFYFSSKYLSFSEKKYIFPNNEALDFISKNQGVYRSLVVGDRKFSNNFATQYKIFNPEGYDSLNNKGYSNFVFNTQGQPQEYIGLRRSDVEIGFEYRLNHAFEDASKIKLLDILGVRYLVTHGEDRTIVSNYDQFKKVFEKGEVAIFENGTALPRAFLASDWREINKDILFLDGKAEIESYKPLNVRIKTDSPEEKFLVLTDNYYSGWKAKVDGKESEILKPNSTFRAVRVESGRHDVEFYYDGDIYKIGALFSSIGIVSLLLTVFIFAREKPRSLSHG